MGDVALDPSRSVSGVAMAHALSHPLRVRILMRMNVPTRRVSPKEFSDETGEALGNCSYHFRQLEKFGCVKVVDEVQRRGAMEHYYEPERRAMAWTREWEALGPVVRQSLTASLLRGGVERIGNAIDSGTFDARNDSHMSWDTAWVDEEGWQQLHRIFQRALEESLIVTTESAKRLENLPRGEQFLVTYLLATFESPPEDEKRD